MDEIIDFATSFYNKVFKVFGNLDITDLVCSSLDYQVLQEIVANVGKRGVDLWIRSKRFVGFSSTDLEEVGGCRIFFDFFSLSIGLSFFGDKLLNRNLIILRWSCVNVESGDKAFATFAGQGLQSQLLFDVVDDFIGIFFVEEQMLLHIKVTIASRVSIDHD